MAKDPTDGYELKCNGIALRLPPRGQNDSGERWGFTLTRKADGRTWTGNYSLPSGMREDEWHSRIKFLMIEGVEADQ